MPALRQINDTPLKARAQLAPQPIVSRLQKRSVVPRKINEKHSLYKPHPQNLRSPANQEKLGSNSCAQRVTRAAESYTAERACLEGPLASNVGLEVSALRRLAERN